MTRRLASKIIRTSGTDREATPDRMARAIRLELRRDAAEVRRWERWRDSHPLDEWHLYRRGRR